MAKVSPRLIVGAFAGMRVAIGAAFALAPDRLSGQSVHTGGGTLMTRSFAVREVALGIGGLLAAAAADPSPAAIRMWAGLGALTDAGDLVASVGARRDTPSPWIPALLATTGLAVELWAFSAPLSG